MVLKYTDWLSLGMKGNRSCFVTKNKPAASCSQEFSVLFALDTGNAAGLHSFQNRLDAFILDGNDPKFKRNLNRYQLYKNKNSSFEEFSEAPTGIEPVIEVLQTFALPLGHGAMCRCHYNIRFVQSQGEKLCAALLPVSPEVWYPLELPE